ncbi:MAG: hypothetical protein M0Z79_07915 [Nitrospiraceae bacterium]|nr:hypothetical protein [Nitrospiraceae bacterium]
MKDRLGNRGFIKGFLLLVVFIGVSYVGIAFGKPYYRYNTLRSHTKDILSSEITDVTGIREKVLAEAKELRVPLTDANLVVTRDGSSKIIKVKGTWSETVDLEGYYQKSLDFVMEVEY